MSRYLLPAFVLTAVTFLPLAATAEPVGEVEVVRTWAYGTPAGGARADLFPRNGIESGEVVETVKGGELRIRFIDGTTLGLAGESAMVIDALVYDPAAGGDSMTLQLTNGFFNFVTGDIDKEAVTITTPSMVIGVRGTDLAISVDANGNTELGVREGTATAAPSAGAEAIEVPEGSTASSSPGDTAIGVAVGLSAAASGAMPGGGMQGGGLGGKSGGGLGGESSGAGDAPEHPVSDATHY